MSSPSSGRFPPGHLIGDRYRIVRRLGRGGMGEVYLADDLKLSQPVALKFLPADVEDDPFRLAQLQNEVRLARQVSHPNVCRVYDLANAGPVHFLTMEYVDGEDLASLQRRIGRLPEDRATAVARQIAAGLAAAHGRGVLHRDLKPANVMMDADGHVRITDFGLAIAGGTADAGLAGTPAYMAPEQLAGGAATEKTDLFALGLVLYELYTGARAFRAGDLDELRSQHAERRFTSPSDLVTNLHPAIDRVILQCLDPDPRKRPAHAIAVSAALPGGDPLAAALAAGETPSPELVAASGGEAATLTPIAGLLLVASVVGMLVVSLAMSDRFRLTALVPIDLSIAALEDRARTFEASLGLPRAGGHRASGLAAAGDAVTWMHAQPPPPSLAERLAIARPAPMVLWYRSSPRPLAPTNAAQPRPSPANPPPSASGMTTLALDTRGRLVEFLHVPVQVESAADRAPGAIDWSRFFDAAGFDRSRFQEATPDWTPRVYADARAAWIGTTPELPDVPIRIEAASHLGWPVSFQIVGPWARPTRMQAAPVDPAADLIARLASVIITPLFLTGGVLLARRNLARGRGDRRGALRLAVLVFGLTLANWAVGAAHFADVQIEQDRFGTALSNALYTGAISGLIYLAIEPQVRRTHPAMLVTWSRLVTGRVRDPLLGRDLVVGAFAGLLCTVISFAPFLLPGWFGWRELIPQIGGLDVFAGLGASLAAVLSLATYSIQNSFLGAVGLVLIQLIVRRAALAFALAVLVFSPLAAAGQIQTGRLALDLFFGAGLVLVVAGVIARFGVVAGAVAFTVHFLTWFFPLTLNVSRFYFPTTVGVVVVVVALAAVGLVFARAREPLFGTLLDD